MCQFWHFAQYQKFSFFFICSLFLLIPKFFKMKLFIISVGKKGYCTEVRCLIDEYKNKLPYNITTIFYINLFICVGIHKTVFFLLRHRCTLQFSHFTDDLTLHKGYLHPFFKDSWPVTKLVFPNIRYMNVYS